MPRPLQPCGTYGAYQRHLRRHEPACEACTRAARQRQAEYRVTSPDARNRERRYQRIRNAALLHLSKEYPARFIEIVDALTAIDQTRPATPPDFPQYRFTPVARRPRCCGDLINEGFSYWCPGCEAEIGANEACTFDEGGYDDD